MRSLVIVTICCSISGLACSSTGGGNAAKGSSRDLLTMAEIRGSSTSSLYDLIRSLRPHWLRVRGAPPRSDPEAGYPVVYVDGGRHGPLESLENLTPEGVAEIRFLSARDATQRYGPGHAGRGAILITSR